MNVSFEQTQNFIVSLTETEGTVSFESSLEMAVTFSEGGELSCVFEPEDDFSVDFGTSVASGDYSGSYTVTPTISTQTLATEGKTLSANITVNPIPSYYGLITWDGSTLTVS